MWTIAYLFLGIPAVMFGVLLAASALRILASLAAGAFFENRWGCKLASAGSAVCYAVFLACAVRIFWFVGVWLTSEPSLALAGDLTSKGTPVAGTMIGAAFLSLMLLTFTDAAPGTH